MKNKEKRWRAKAEDWPADWKNDVRVYSTPQNLAGMHVLTFAKLQLR